MKKIDQYQDQMSFDSKDILIKWRKEQVVELKESVFNVLSCMICKDQITNW